MTDRLHTRVRTILLLAWAMATSAVAQAQVPTVPEPLADPFVIRRAPGDLDALTRLYNASDWTAIQRLARELACVARRNASEPIYPDETREYESCGAAHDAPEGPVADALDVRRRHVAVMWMGTDAFGKARLMRVVVTASERPPYGSDLPGVPRDADDGLTELFLSRSPLGRATTVYTSARENDSRLAQLPAFVQGLAGPLFASVATLAGRIPGQETEAVREPRRPKLWATVKRVGLPFRRASVRLQAIGREPLSSAAFAADASRLARDLAFSKVPHEPCAIAFARTLADDLPAVTQERICGGADASPAGCLSAFDDLLQSRFERAVEQCGAGASRAAVSAIGDVDGAFRTLVEKGTAASAELELTFANRPLTHLSFGAGAAVVLAASLNRARVDTRSGVLVADPLSRAMTLAFVNWSPAGYDEKNPHVDAAERVRPFFGVALTPDFGPAIGVNVLLAHGIGVTAGGALLVGKGADAGEIGARPPRPEDPYRPAIARAVFAGISYSYK